LRQRARGEAEVVCERHRKVSSVVSKRFTGGGGLPLTAQVPGRRRGRPEPSPEARRVEEAL
ncbi:MAG: hypothetical protein AAGF23_24025, partial [Acidobacteriota bacterium]